MKTKRMVYFFSACLAQLFLFIFLALKKGRQEFLALKIFSPIIKFFPAGLVVFRQDYDALAKKIVHKAILALPSLGCEHYFKNGGCSMCGFNNEIKKYSFRNLHPKAITFFTLLLLVFLKKTKEESNRQISSLAVFMGGSFFNAHELPGRAQAMIFDFFAKSDIKKLSFESRPEYIAEGLKKMADWHLIEKDKQVDIAIGLEAADDKIRNEYIRKNISRPDYQRAVKAIKDAGYISSTYVLIGSPHLSEEKVIGSAVNTALFAWWSGTDVVNLEAYSVQSDTPWANLYRKGLIKPPSLWAITEVVKRIDHASPNWYLGEFSDWPEPIAKPGSCPGCEKEYLSILGDLRTKHDTKAITNRPLCQCRS